MLMPSATLARSIKALVMPSFWVLSDFARQAANIIPETWDRFSFRHFWGDAILPTDAYFVIASYENESLRNKFRNSERTDK